MQKPSPSPDMTAKLNRIKSALRESIEIAEKATDGPWEVDKASTWDQSIAVQPCIFQRNAWTSDKDAAFIAHARTMTPLACKVLLLAIEGLELMICDPDHGGEMCSNEGWGCPACEAAKNTLASITSTWPDA
jgi:hypothetical protein